MKKKKKKVEELKDVYPTSKDLMYYILKIASKRNWEFEETETFFL